MSESDSTISGLSTSDITNSSYQDSSSSTSYNSASSISESETDSADESNEPNSSVASERIMVSSSSSLIESEPVATESFTVETMRAPVETTQVSFNVGSDTELEWDVTNNSLDVPRSDGPRSSPIRSFVANVKSLLSRRSRQRRWSLEECSICCEVMLNDQQLQTLACSHHFHTACVRPWLEEHQTCPNCRKQA